MSGHVAPDEGAVDTEELRDAIPLPILCEVGQLPLEVFDSSHRFDARYFASEGTYIKRCLNEDCTKEEEET